MIAWRTPLYLYIVTPLSAVFGILALIFFFIGCTRGCSKCRVYSLLIFAFLSPYSWFLIGSWSVFLFAILVVLVIFLIILFWRLIVGKILLILLIIGQFLVSYFLILLLVFGALGVIVGIVILFFGIVNGFDQIFG